MIMRIHCCESMLITRRRKLHERFTVLNEKTDGYYAIVLPGTNRILRYDKKEGHYIFHEGE